jgi:hypothetical protein
MSPNIFVYAPRLSSVAAALTEALGAKRLRNFDGLNFWNKGKVMDIPEGAVIVNWGSRLPELDNVRVLNPLTKSKESPVDTIQTLRDYAGIQQPQVWFGSKLHPSLRGEWIPRRSNRTPCEDIINPPTVPVYFSQRVTFTHEYRLHVFNNKTIKSGEKLVRDGFTLALSHEDWMKRKDTEKVAHPWWRHFQTGWTVNYADFTADASMRTIATKAFKTLKFMFGSVDIGQTADGSLYVLSVNNTPYLDEALIQRYVKLINKWIEAPLADADEPEAKPVATAADVGGGYIEMELAIPAPAFPNPPAWDPDNGAIRHLAGPDVAARRARRVEDARRRVAQAGMVNYRLNPVAEAPPPPHPRDHLADAMAIVNNILGEGE